MPRLKNSEVDKREQWVMEQFRRDPRISGPDMNKLLKQKYKNAMRMTRIYELREEVLSDLKWKKDKYGHPLPPAGWVSPEEHEAHVEVSANRTGETQAPTTVADNPLAGRCVVPVASIEDGVNFARKLEVLNKDNFIQPKLKVEAVGPTYVVVAPE